MSAPEEFTFESVRVIKDPGLVSGTMRFRSNTLNSMAFNAPNPENAEPEFHYRKHQFESETGHAPTECFLSSDLFDNLLTHALVSQQIPVRSLAEDINRVRAELNTPYGVLNHRLFDMEPGAVNYVPHRTLSQARDVEQIKNRFLTYIRDGEIKFNLHRHEDVGAYYRCSIKINPTHQIFMPMRPGEETKAYRLGAYKAIMAWVKEEFEREKRENPECEVR